MCHSARDCEETQWSNNWPLSFSQKFIECMHWWHLLEMVVMESRSRPKKWMQDLESSIKLKIDWRVGASLLKLEFDWCSWIPTEDTSIVVSTEWLLKKSTMIAFQIDLPVQFIRVPFLQRWTVLNVRYYALFQTKLFKQTGPFFLPPLCSFSGSSYKL